MSEKKRIYPAETGREKPLKLQRFPDEERGEPHSPARRERPPASPSREVVQRLIELFKEL